MTTKANRIHLNKVAALGCVVCVMLKFGASPAEVHHIRDGYGRGQRAPDTETLPLCAIHHRIGDGTAKYRGQVGFHFNPAEFTKLYGSERYLLQIVRRKLDEI